MCFWCFVNLGNDPRSSSFWKFRFRPKHRLGVYGVNYQRFIPENFFSNSSFFQRNNIDIWRDAKTQRPVTTEYSLCDLDRSREDRSSIMKSWLDATIQESDFQQKKTPETRRDRSKTTTWPECFFFSNAWRSWASRSSVCLWGTGTWLICRSLTLHSDTAVRKSIADV